MKKFLFKIKNFIPLMRKILTFLGYVFDCLEDGELTPKETLDLLEQLNSFFEREETEDGEVQE